MRLLKYTIAPNGKREKIKFNKKSVRISRGDGTSKLISMDKYIARNKEYQRQLRNYRKDIKFFEAKGIKNPLLKKPIFSTTELLKDRRKYEKPFTRVTSATSKLTTHFTLKMDRQLMGLREAALSGEYDVTIGEYEYYSDKKVQNAIIQKQVNELL